MLSEILTDPFGTKHPSSLASAMKLSKAILRACWPRIPHYCNDIVKILTLSWLNIEDEESLPSDSPVVGNLKSQLVDLANMLSAIMKAAKVDFRKRIDLLVQEEQQLNQLFREISI